MWDRWGRLALLGHLGLKVHPDHPLGLFPPVLALALNRLNQSLTASGL